MDSSTSLAATSIRAALGVGDYGISRWECRCNPFQLHHLGSTMIRRGSSPGGLIEHTDEQKLMHTDLPGTGGAGDEHVGEFGAVPHNVVAPDVLAHGEGH